MSTHEKSPFPYGEEFNFDRLFEGSRHISSLEFVRVTLTDVMPEAYQCSPEEGRLMSERAFELVQKYGFQDRLNPDIEESETKRFRRLFMDAEMAYNDHDYEDVEADPEIVDSVSSFIEVFEEKERLNRMSVEAYQTALKMLFVVLEPQRFSEFK